MLTSGLALPDGLPSPFTLDQGLSLTLSPRIGAIHRVNPLIGREEILEKG